MNPLVRVGIQVFYNMGRLDDSDAAKAEATRLFHLAYRADLPPWIAEHWGFRFDTDAA